MRRYGPAGTARARCSTLLCAHEYAAMHTAVGCDAHLCVGASYAKVSPGDPRAVSATLGQYRTSHSERVGR
eukprot:1039246-Rhodomonas_salina.3